MRVAVTTAPDRQAEVSRLVAEAGFEPIRLPCLRVTAASTQRLDEARRAAQQSDRIIFSSRRAIEVLWPDGGMPATPALAVGRQTAAAIDAAGGATTLVGDSDLTTLLTQAARSVPVGLRILIIHPEGAEPDATSLGASGFAVATAAVYRVEPVAPDPAPEVDAALFGSSTTIEGWRLSRPLTGIVRAAIGRPTAGDLARLGAPAHVVADPPSYSNLVDGLQTHIHRYQRRSS